ncbi:MAG TPA: LytR C-terminal domain-containing protein [Micropruina sp.]|nr:LytR C-terminal domain-containing protein [Micropruina sp.]HMR20712.1 LytR C-terminal domain-containing protein [Micropruina sp.]
MRQIIRMFKTPLTLLALTALVAFGGIWGYHNATAQIPPRPPEPCVKTEVGGKLTPHYVTLRVLNAGLQGGLAKRVSGALRSYGFNIFKVNNTEERLADTVIVGNSPDSPEVKLVAGFFKNAKVAGDGRIDHMVDVLLGDNYQGRVTKPKESIAVSGPVCLPALPASAVSALPTVSASPKPSVKPSPKKS